MPTDWIWDDPPMNDFRSPGYTKLPCGGFGYPDGCGIRCMKCLTIYGSIDCPCRERSYYDLPIKEEGK